MAKDRITDQTILADFSDGDVLYGSDINKIIKVFKEGINKNKIDLNRILTGSEYFYIADDLSGLTALISEQVPSDGQRGYVFDGRENQGNLEIYLYNELAGVWEFLQKTSITSPFTDSITISNTAGLSKNDLDVIGKILYDNERHALCYLTDLGDIVEIGSTLGGFGKNPNGTTYIGQPVVLTGVHGVDAIKTFVPASAGSKELSTMVGVLASSVEGSVLNPNELGKITVFGDIDIPNFEHILDLNFLDDLGIDFIKDIPFGTKLYLSVETGKYSAVEPLRPNQAIWVSTVLDVKPDNSGRIFVFPQRLRLAGVDIQISDTQPTDQNVGDFWYHTSGASPQTYTITWKAYDGTTLKSQTLSYGETSTAPIGTTDTAQYQYDWPKSSTTVVGTETITETLTIKSYTITWYFYNGAVAKQETRLYDTTSIAPTGTPDDSSWDYYWPQDSVVVTGPQTIQETRRPISPQTSYTITWYKYGQSGETYAKQENLTYGETSIAPTGTTDTAQYEYKWPQDSVVVTGNETITETRTTKWYTITWIAYNGAILESDRYVYDYTVYAPTGTPDDSGWDYYWPQDSVVVTGPQTIQETRRPIQKLAKPQGSLTDKFDYTDGANDVGGVMVIGLYNSNDEGVTLRGRILGNGIDFTNEFSHFPEAGYYFFGDGFPPNTGLTDGLSVITRALWTYEWQYPVTIEVWFEPTSSGYSTSDKLIITVNPEMITATFDSNGGSPTYTSQSGYDSLDVTNPGTPIRSGYTFTGWSPALPQTITSDTTFVAQWQVTSVTATPTIDISCMIINGVSTLRVSVTNNDAVAALIRYVSTTGGSTVLGELNPGASTTYNLSDTGVEPPYQYNVTINATATGKTVSSNVTRTGTLMYCVAGEE